MLYTNFPPDTTLYQEGSIPLLKQGHYTYPLHSKYAANYLFSISALYNTGEKSLPIHIKNVKSMQQIFPGVSNFSIQQEDAAIILNWEYPYPTNELLGFRLYSDNQILVDEKTLHHEIRSLTLSLKQGEKIRCRIVPVYINKIEGKESKTITLYHQ